MHSPLLLLPGVTDLLSRHDPGEVCVVSPYSLDARHLSVQAGYSILHLTRFPDEPTRFKVLFASLVMEGFFQFMQQQQTKPIQIIAIIDLVAEELATAKLVGVPYVLRQAAHASRVVKGAW